MLVLAACGDAGEPARVEEAHHLGGGRQSAPEVEALEVRARSGDIGAMHTLAVHHWSVDGESEKALGWLRKAASLGDCLAVGLLAEPHVGLSSEEQGRWRAEVRRRQCDVPRWASVPGGAVLFALPDDSGWQMRIECVAGAIEVAGPAHLTAPAEPMIFRTSRGAHRRAVATVSHFWVAAAYRAAPGDEVLQALLRGETIEAEIPGGQPWRVDGRGSAGHLRPLVDRCRKSGRR